MTISVVIPSYEMHGFGAAFLAQALASIASQTLPPMEILVGDQSLDGVLKPVCAEWADRLDVRWIDTSFCRGSPSANLNALVARTRGAIVKILFQDDLLSTDDALASTASAFAKSPHKAWLVSAQEHTFDAIIAHRPFAPVLQERLRYGVNTFGPPSTISFRRPKYLPFDPDLSWMMDVEWYDRMKSVLGPPILHSTVTVASREWGRQNTHALADERKRREEASILRAAGSATMGPATLLATHHAVLESLVGASRSAKRSGSDARSVYDAAEGVARCSPLDLAALTHIFCARSAMKDASWRRAAALLISYHTSEPIAREAVSALLSGPPEAAGELAGFRRSLSTYATRTVYPMRLLPVWGEPEPLQAAFESLRRAVQLFQAIHGRRAFDTAGGDGATGVGYLEACMTRASALAKSKGLSGRPKFVCDPLWPEMENSGDPLGAVAEESGVVVALFARRAGRRSVRARAQATCANGGYVLGLDLSAAAMFAPQRLRMPDDLRPMVTVEHVVR